MNKPIICLKKSVKSGWVSCQSITQNLFESYQKAFGEDRVYELSYDEGMDRFQIHQLIQELVKLNPEKLVFIDHKPHPADLVTILHIEQALEIELVFHVFGDFVLEAVGWSGIEHLLKDFKVRFICASHKQQELLSRFIDDSDPVLAQIPFPVSNASFSYDSSLREAFRKRLSIDDNQYVFIYTGRISLQKNVAELILAFLAMVKQLGDDDIHLVIAGEVDDLGLPYIGKRSLPGGYFASIQEAVERVEKAGLRKRIHFLGQIDHEELRETYCGSDGFISLSTHNDEDYGMSIAESMMCGLPVLITRWGGYQSFLKLVPSAGQLIPVSCQDRPVPSMKQTVKQMWSFSKRRGEYDRNEIAEVANHYFSIEAVAEQLSALYKSDAIYFTSFNDQFIRLKSAFVMNPMAPFRCRRAQFSSFYQKVYSCYWEE